MSLKTDARPMTMRRRDALAPAPPLSSGSADALADDPTLDVDPSVLGGRESRSTAAARQLARVACAASFKPRRAHGGTFAVDVVRLQGCDPATGERLALIYIGDGADLDYVRDLAFPSGAIATGLERRRSPLAVRALLRRHGTGADIVVIDTRLAIERLIVPRAFHRLPRWVKQTLAVGGPERALHARVGTSTLAWARRVFRRYGYRIDLAATDQGRMQFFQELYRPFLRARFGADAIVVDEDRFRHETRGAGVLRLWSGNEVVAGALVRAVGTELQIVWFGARTDAVDRGLKGFADALDYAALCLARRGGFERLHFGSSRPSLADGVLRYKQKWGATPALGRLPRADLRLAVDPASAAARGFLSRARLIVRVGSALHELTPAGAARSRDAAV